MPKRIKRKKKVKLKIGRIIIALIVLILAIFVLKKVLNFAKNNITIITKEYYLSSNNNEVDVYTYNEETEKMEDGEKVSRGIKVKSHDNTKIIDEVTYQENDSYHTFYYSLAIESEIEQFDSSKENHIHTSICGFIDKDGNLSSQIYDIESNAFYSSYMYGPDTLSPRFYDLVKKLTKEYEKSYYEKFDHIDAVLNYMYENSNMSEKPKDYKDGKKILEFKPNNKE